MEERRHATPLCGTTPRAVVRKWKNVVTPKELARPTPSRPSAARPRSPLEENGRRTPSRPLAARPSAVGSRYENVITPQGPARPTPSRLSTARPGVPLKEDARTSSRHGSQHGPLRPAPLRHDIACRWKKTEERPHATGASTAHSVHGRARRWEKMEERRRAMEASTAHSVPLVAARPREPLGENGETSSRHRSQHGPRCAARPPVPLDHRSKHGPLRPAPLRHDRACRWEKQKERRHATGASTAHSDLPVCGTTARAVGTKWKNVVTPRKPARPTPSRPSVAQPCAPLGENGGTSSRQTSNPGPLHPALLRQDRALPLKKMQERRHATGASTAHAFPPLCLTTAAVGRKCKNVVTPLEPARPTPSRPSAS